MILARICLVLAATLIVYACAAGGQADTSASKAEARIADLRAQMKAHLGDCSELYSFDPQNVEAGYEDRLAPGERAWRDCAYEGVWEIFVANTDMPEMYRQLIAEDRALTNLMGQGELNRSQRMSRMRDHIAAVEAAEIDKRTSGDPSFSELERQKNEAFVRDMRSMFR